MCVHSTKRQVQKGDFRVCLCQLLGYETLGSVRQGKARGHRELLARDARTARPPTGISNRLGIREDRVLLTQGPC